jgi:hypothetical protein
MIVLDLAPENLRRRARLLEREQLYGEGRADKNAQPNPTR